MRKLLTTTAIAASMGFAGAASADSDSLLQEILEETSATQLQLLNAAENLADIDASVTIQAFGAEGLEDVLDALSGDLDESFSGMFSEVAFTDGGQTGSGEFFDPADLIAALQTQVNDVSTTAIGALNTGVVGNVMDTVEGDNSTQEISASVMNLMNATQQSVAQTSNSLATSTEFEVVNPVQIANLAFNNAEQIDASVSVAQLLSNVDGISTTAIGALNTGNIATDIATNTSSLTESIVGN